MSYDNAADRKDMKMNRVDIESSRGRKDDPPGRDLSWWKAISSRAPSVPSDVDGRPRLEMSFKLRGDVVSCYYPLPCTETRKVWPLDRDRQILER
jgi:hypothetical protein